MTVDPVVDRKKVLQLCEALAEIGAAGTVNELAEAWKDVARLRADVYHGLMLGGSGGTGVQPAMVSEETRWEVELLGGGDEWFTLPHYEWDSLDEAMDNLNGDGHGEYRRRLVRVDEKRTVLKVRGAYEKSKANDT
jgi:hypothetical protein